MRPLAATLLPTGMLVLMLCVAWAFGAASVTRQNRTIYEQTLDLCHSIHRGEVDSVLQSLPDGASSGDVRSTFALRIERRVGQPFSIRRVRRGDDGAWESQVIWSSGDGSPPIRDRFHWLSLSDGSLLGWSTDR